MRDVAVVVTFLRHAHGFVVKFAARLLASHQHQSAQPSIDYSSHNTKDLDNNKKNGKNANIAMHFHRQYSQTK